MTNKTKIIIILFLGILAGCINKKIFVKEWTINTYKIKLYRGQGLVGPVYYYYTLDKSNVLSGIFFKSRKTFTPFEDLKSCSLTFNKNSETKFTFDICTNSADPKKEKLNSDNITSIKVTRIDSMSVKNVVLNDVQKKIFIESWNRNNKYTSGSPRIKYLISVNQGYVRTFNSDGFYLYEQPYDAKYKFSDTTFFRSLFGN